MTCCYACCGFTDGVVRKTFDLTILNQTWILNQIDDLRKEFLSDDTARKLEIHDLNFKGSFDFIRLYDEVRARTFFNDFSKTLIQMPVEIDEQGNEFVLFDETIISEGCKKWEKTLCGYFVGQSMSVNELSFIIPKALNWMVNSKPFFVQKWDIHVCLDKKEPEMIPIWVRLCNVPLEAWTTKGISALASRLGKPLVMDNVTAEMCKMGVGRVRYARILVQVSAKKVLPQEIEIVYRDKGNEEICRKVIHVKYDWKPTRCSECCVFGHNVDNCVKNKPNKEKDVTVNKPVQDKPNGNVDTNDNGGYTEVIYRKKNGIGNKSKNNNWNKQQKNHGMGAQKEKACSRIMVGWNSELVNVNIIHYCKQAVLCKVDASQGSLSLFCTIVYAANGGMERIDLWKELKLHKGVVGKDAWIIMGDMNVTLDPSEHSSWWIYFDKRHE
ncbi:RNA-directed DNA polymerase, eukaryota, reverse transcriptase zinc-binding domain protein [Tanacetum coccineum]